MEAWKPEMQFSVFIEKHFTDHVMVSIKYIHVQHTNEPILKKKCFGTRQYCRGCTRVGRVMGEDVKNFYPLFGAMPWKGKKSGRELITSTYCQIFLLPIQLYSVSQHGIFPESCSHEQSPSFKNIVVSQPVTGWLLSYGGSCVTGQCV